MRPLMRVLGVVLFASLGACCVEPGGYAYDGGYCSSSCDYSLDVRVDHCGYRRISPCRPTPVQGFRSTGPSHPYMPSSRPGHSFSHGGGHVASGGSHGQGGQSGGSHGGHR